MKQQTVNVLKVIVRLFIEVANYNDGITATTSKIHTDVCRQLKITRQANKNNYRGAVIKALRLLKKRIVLFETVVPKENDILNKAVPVDNRTVFGLTNAVEDYLTSPNTTNTSNTSDRYIIELLQHFGVLSPETAPQPHDQPQPEENVMPTDNVAQLVEIVNTAAAQWLATVTPADLLGAMYALHIEDSQHPDREWCGMLSMTRLGWPMSKAHNYAKCYKVLERAGLIEAYKVQQHTQKDGKVKLRPYGFKLTPLGIEVAIVGNFQDTRKPGNLTAAEQKRRREVADRETGSTPTAPKPQKGDMLKGEKVTHKIKSYLAADREAALIDRMERLLNNMIENNNQRFDAIDRRMQKFDGGGPESEQLAPSLADQPEARSHKQLDDDTTIATFLTSAAPLVIAAIHDLIDEKAGASEINAEGLYYAITELSAMLRGIKSYLDKCIENNTTVDRDMLDQYAIKYYEAARNVADGRWLPVLGEEFSKRRALRGIGRAIDRVVCEAVTEPSA
jgi:hypothetical protein